MQDEEKEFVKVKTPGDSEVEVWYDADDALVRTIIRGRLNSAVADLFFREMGRVAFENKCLRVLSDLREAKLDGSSFDMYFEAKTSQRKASDEQFSSRYSSQSRSRTTMIFGRRSVTIRAL